MNKKHSEVIKEVAQLMTRSIEEMQEVDKGLRETYDLEDYIEWALEEVETNEGVVIERVTNHA